MKAFGLVGWSGSGKTTLLVRLIPELIGRGISVSTVKHTHHSVEVDRPGKDSYRHREAGATEVLVASSSRYTLIHEYRGEPEADMDTLVRLMALVDLILIEGFKRNPHPKMEVYRHANGKDLWCREDPTVVAIATDVPLPDVALPQLALDDVAAIADFIIDRCGLAAERKGAAE